MLINAKYTKEIPTYGTKDSNPISTQSLFKNLYITASYKDQTSRRNGNKCGNKATLLEQVVKVMPRRETYAELSQIQEGLRPRKKYYTS